MEKYIFELIEIKRKGVDPQQQICLMHDLFSYPTILKIGERAMIPMNNDKILKTSSVKNFELWENYMVVETDNTIYTFRK
ncbi:MAG: hypothetical protein ACRCZ0_01690 [Cetobacterium sp.]